ALTDAFTSTPSLVPEPEPAVDVDASPAAVPAAPPSEGDTVPPASDADTDHDEYDSYLTKWRAESAEQREKAEKERARWEDIRAAEKQEGSSRQGQSVVNDGWESVGQLGQSSVSSPSPADVRDLVTGEAQGTNVDSISTPPSMPDTGDDSQKWENVSSGLDSSYPSLSFPDTASPPVTTPPKPVESATLAVFDPSLSTRTRVTALFSALAINLLLPFVNGVMLGFGEIFAKNIVLEYFGWRPLGRPGSTAASAGIRAGLRRSDKK
ncbi:unnamed protein product, partial [Mycena citricolor]